MRKPNKGKNNTIRFSSNKEVDFIKWLDVFMERYGMSYGEFLELPIPTFYALSKLIIKENKKSPGK